MDLGISDRVAPLLNEVKEFIDREVLPVEKEFHDEIGVGEVDQCELQQADQEGRQRVLEGR